MSMRLSQHFKVTLALGLISWAGAQQVGTYIPEVHPTLQWSNCATGGSCTSTTGSVTLDANWRWLHDVSSTTNCFTGNEWDATLCYEPAACASKCALEGVDYAGTYGVTTSGNSLGMREVTDSGESLGARLYLMANTTSYQLFKPLNREFAFTVDASNLPCGVSGSVRFTSMDADGGLAKYSSNKAGAQYGTGYCDSQCPRDLKFINGQANILDWTAASNDPNSGTGLYGSCCSEFSLMEGNGISEAYTAYPCAGAASQTRCSEASCGASSSSPYAGLCDPDGCDFNSYRMGNTTFYGSAKTVDTRSQFTVVTQFVTTDGTDNGDLVEVKRFYIQNGKMISNSAINVSGVNTANYISDQVCAQQKVAFNDTDSFTAQGGLSQLGSSLKQGVVLVFALWGKDLSDDLLWLDSDWPLNESASTPGVARGTCIRSDASIPPLGATSSVIFSNIKFGPIGSTYNYTAS